MRADRARGGGLGSLRYAQGRFREASRWLAQARLHYERRDPFGLVVIASAYQAAVACATDDAGAAREALERCRAAVRGESPPLNQLPHLLWAEGQTAMAEGYAERAARLMLDGTGELVSSPLDAAFLAYEALRVGAPPAAVAPTLLEIDARSDAGLITAAATHAAGCSTVTGRCS